MPEKGMDKWEINWSEIIHDCNIKINGEMLRGVQVLEFKPKSTYEYDPKTEEAQYSPKYQRGH